MGFSAMLKKLREERHLSQKDVADYLGVTRQAIASYELAKREPDYEVLRKLADYFGVSVDYLLGRSKYDSLIGLMDNDLKQWIVKENNLQYVKLAREIKEAGIEVELMKPIIDDIKKNRKLSQQ